jgi:hypothetical protein
MESDLLVQYLGPGSQCLNQYLLLSAMCPSHLLGGFLFPRTEVRLIKKKLIPFSQALTRPGAPLKGGLGLPVPGVQKTSFISSHEPPAL